MLEQLWGEEACCFVIETTVEPSKREQPGTEHFVGAGGTAIIFIASLHYFHIDTNAVINAVINNTQHQPTPFEKLLARQYQLKEVASCDTRYMYKSHLI